MMQMQMQMQMGAMAQMQKMQMGGMPMAPMMPMMAGMMQGNMPMVPMMPQGPAAPSAAAIEKAEEDAKLANCTLDDLAALEKEVKECEDEERKKLRKDCYIGVMARYIEGGEGFGFISCQEAKKEWGKTDIFVTGMTFTSSGIEVGDMVVFAVEKDIQKRPRAVTPKTLVELTKLTKKLKRMREALESAGVLPANAGASSGGATS